MFICHLQRRARDLFSPCRRLPDVYGTRGSMQFGGDPEMPRVPGVLETNRETNAELAGANLGDRYARSFAIA